MLITDLIIQSALAFIALAGVVMAWTVAIVFLIFCSVFIMGAIKKGSAP